MEVWKGDLVLQNGGKVPDIRLSTTSVKPPLSSISNLEFLSHVDVSRIPLHLICGPRMDVWTTTPETESWFSNLLFQHAAEEEEERWWHSACPESPLGILAAVQTEDPASHPRTTEMLFYAARDSTSTTSPPPTPPYPSQPDVAIVEPRFQIYALPLSSDLHPSNTIETTPPPSPTPTHEARFLTRPWECNNHMLLLEKRKRALDSTFKAADERRKRAKRHTGESVAAAAAAGANTVSASCVALPSLKHRTSDRRDGSRAKSQGVVSRSPSTAARLRRSETTEFKRSGLAFVTPAAVAVENGDVENGDVLRRNKDFVSRIVMAGMRVWGFEQRKRAKRRSGALDILPSDQLRQQQQQRQNQGVSEKEEKEEKEKEEREISKQTDNDKDDEEYKLIYHNVYKSAVFAFRKHMAEKDLTMTTTTTTTTMASSAAADVRDVVDALLGVFCRDPLGSGGVSFVGGGGSFVGGGGEEEKGFKEP